jgi:hypothetical protein
MLERVNPVRRVVSDTESQSGDIMRPLTIGLGCHQEVKFFPLNLGYNSTSYLLFVAHLGLLQFREISDLDRPLLCCMWYHSTMVSA